MVRSGDKELLEGAKAIASDVRLPGSRTIKLARIIDRHLDWFDAARARGLEWSDIVTMLFNAGVTRADGRPLSRGHVSSLVWRKQAAMQKRAAAVPPQPAGHDRGGHADTGRSERSTTERAVSTPSKPRAPSVKRAATAKGPPAGSATKNQDVLAFMKRAAAIRKR